LRILWERGPSTVRQVHEAQAGTRDTGYTTTLKLMQIMADKGLVKRDESARTHVYAPLATEQQTQRQLLKDLVDRAFGGSAAALVLQALNADGASPAELQQIRKLIDDYREKRQ
jgi:predicted transcriptional regulator